MILEDWEVVEVSKNVVTENKLRIRVKGRIFGHKRYQDNQHILTSILTGCKDKYIIASNGHKFELGTMNKKFKESGKMSEIDLFNILRG